MKWFDAVRIALANEWHLLSGKRLQRQVREFAATAAAFKQDMERVLARISSGESRDPPTDC
jgi:hypothetical protein